MGFVMGLKTEKKFKKFSLEAQCQNMEYFIFFTKTEYSGSYVTFKT